jgi:hypothetical protein
MRKLLDRGKLGLDILMNLHDFSVSVITEKLFLCVIRLAVYMAGWMDGWMDVL